MADVSNKLLDQQAGRLLAKSQEARLGDMLAAWRAWRAGLIRAMAKHVDSGADDKVMASLQAEMLHVAHVGEALQHDRRGLETSYYYGLTDDEE